MAKIVNALAEVSAVVILVGGNFRHGEVGLAKNNALRVDADENLRDGLNVQIGVEFNQAKFACS